MVGVPDMILAIGEAQARVYVALCEWDANHNSERLWQGDPSLWSGADEDRWTGWLQAVGPMVEQVGVLQAFSDGVRADGFTDVVLLGMGGSSLCPEVLAMTYGQAEGFPRLHVLDSTVPEQVRRFRDAVDLETTLCIVASKSGSTTEPNAFCEYFWDEMQRAVGDQAGAHFVAITDPGSMLQELAETRGFRRIFLGVPEIGGRFSALSPFGMVPAALIGFDLAVFLQRALAMVERCGPQVSAGENPGVALGIVLGELAKMGRDKVTLVASPQIWDLGAWLEQLVAESTGKAGVGLVPVDLESLAPSDHYGQDRVFVYVRLVDGADAEQDAQVEALIAAGQPVVRLNLEDALFLGAEFFRWEIATATVGAVLGINPFDQPNVQESKDFTARLTQAYETEGALPHEAPRLTEGGVVVFADDANASSLGALSGVGQALLAHLGRLTAGDYLALCAYLDMREDVVALMQDLRHRIRDRYRVATTLGFGPRFLHSTGQLHKGGSNQVVVIQLTSANTLDLAIPGRRFTFGVLKDAQALGDAQALSARNRRTLRLRFEGDLIDGLRQIIEAVS